MTDDGLIVDSAMDFAGAVAGTDAPQKILEVLCLIDVRYVGFDGLRHAGQLVGHRDLAAEIRAIFLWLERRSFPIGRVVPIVRYGWSDDESMSADNTSAFNYRFIAGTDRLSRHATGQALDINPLRNPVIAPDGHISPAGAVYRPGSPGTFGDGDPAVETFRQRGWRWGGHFDHIRDYHHFEK